MNVTQVSLSTIFSTFLILIMPRSLSSFAVATAFGLLATLSLSAQGQNTTPPADSTLQQGLDQMKERFAKRMSAEQTTANEKSIADIAETNVLERALKVGSKAPMFSLPNAKGGTTSLEALLKNGAAIVTFYRGGWCPFCNLQLRAMQQYLPEFRTMNATLVAISPEMPDSSMKTADKNKLQFEVMSDAGNTVAKAFGVVYTLPEKMRAAYQSMLQRYNGVENAGELPIAATYVINKQGIVTYAFLDTDYRKRAEPASILRHLKELAKAAKQ
jgi:peroxiredoxin